MAAQSVASPYAGVVKPVRLDRTEGVEKGSYVDSVKISICSSWNTHRRLTL